MKKALVIAVLIFTLGTVSAFAGNFNVAGTLTIAPQTAGFTVLPKVSLGYTAPELYWNIGAEFPLGVSITSLTLFTNGGFTANIYETQTSSMDLKISGESKPTFTFAGPTNIGIDWSNWDITGKLEYLSGPFEGNFTITYPVTTFILGFKYTFPEISTTKPVGGSQ